MIFVTVGSGDFDPLIRQMDRLAPQLDLPVVMQIGLGKYEPMHAEFFRFAPSLAPYYERADLVVAHGGVGVTLEVLTRHIPLVSVDNPDRPDHHQDDILSHLASQGYLLWCRDLTRLGVAIAQARTTTFPAFELPPLALHLVVAEFLETLAAGGDTKAVAKRYRGRQVRPQDFL